MDQPKATGVVTPFQGASNRQRPSFSKNSAGHTLITFYFPDDGLSDYKDEARHKANRGLQTGRLQSGPYKYDQRWWDVMGGTGKFGYEHHLLEVNRTYTVCLVPGDALTDDERSTEHVLNYGIDRLKYGHPRAALIPELFWMLPHEELRSQGYRYVAAIHNRLEVLGDHRRMFFQLGADFDDYFDPQRDDFWKRGGLFAFPLVA